MGYKVNYAGDVGGDGPSPIIWGNCPWLEALEDPNVGYGFWDDFLNFGDHISTQQTQQYATYIDSGVTLKQSSAGVGGYLEVAGNDADNDEGIITTGGNAGGPFMISDAAANARKLWFECRFKKASIADNACAFAVGLAEEGLAAENTLIDATGEFAAKDFVGFRVKHDNGKELDIVYGKAATPTELIANTHTMVADTFVKCGFIYNPGAVAAKRMTFYVDGVEKTTYITGTIIATSVFPDAEELALLLATKVGETAESKFQMDWWRVFQER